MAFTVDYKWIFPILNSPSFNFVHRQEELKGKKWNRAELFSSDSIHVAYDVTNVLRSIITQDFFLITGVYTRYKQFLSKDKVILKRIIKVSVNYFMKWIVSYYRTVWPNYLMNSATQKLINLNYQLNFHQLLYFFNVN